MHSLSTHEPSPSDRAALVGDLLLDIHALRGRTAVPGLMRDVLEALRRKVPCTAAWWGLSGGLDATEVPQFLHVDSVDLPDGLFDAYLPFAAEDPFARRVLTGPGKVHAFTGYGTPDERVNALGRQHDLYHGISMCCAEPFSGHLCFVALYRGQRMQAFDDIDALLLRQAVLHAARLLHWMLQDAMAAATRGAHDLLLMAWPDGEVLQARGDVQASIAARWPGLGAVPPELLTLEEGAQVDLGGRMVRLARQGGMICLVEQAAPASGALSPRELRVAQQFASGRSYKEIARSLDLSPATVRTYLRNAYIRLGVRNKVELGRKLADEPGSRAPPGGTHS